MMIAIYLLAYVINYQFFNLKIFNKILKITHSIDYLIIRKLKTSQVYYNTKFNYLDYMFENKIEFIVKKD